MTQYRHVDMSLALQLFSNPDRKDPDICDLSWVEDLSGFKSVGSGTTPIANGANYYDTSFFSTDIRLFAVRLDMEASVILYAPPGFTVTATIPVIPIGDGRYGYVLFSAANVTFMVVNALAAGQMTYAMFADLP